MADYPIKHSERVRVVSLLSKQVKLHTSEERVDFIDRSGLYEYHDRFTFDGTSEEFALRLIREAQHIGLVESADDHAVRLILKELAKALKGFPDEVKFVDGLINRPLLDEDNKQIINPPKPTTDLVPPSQSLPEKYVRGIWGIILVIFGWLFLSNLPFNFPIIEDEVQNTPIPTQNSTTSLNTPTTATSTLTSTPVEPTLSPSTTYLPPVDSMPLSEWLLEVAREPTNLEAAKELLFQNNLIQDWNTNSDITNDGINEWVVVTNPIENNCNSIFIINPAIPEIIEDSSTRLEENTVYIYVQRAEDITGDGVTDILYVAVPYCTGFSPDPVVRDVETIYYLWSISNNKIEGSNEVTYLLLLHANYLFEQNQYESARVIYHEIVFTNTRRPTMWNQDRWSDEQENIAIVRFAIVRLLLSSMVDELLGTDLPVGGIYNDYLNNYIKRYNLDNNATEIFALEAMIDTFSSSHNPNLTCVGFDNAITLMAPSPIEDADLTHPLASMGSIRLTWEDICPL